MAYAEKMIAEAEAARDRALAEGDETQARRCETQIAYWERVKRDVDAAPPLSPAVRDKLIILLRRP